MVIHLRSIRSERGRNQIGCKLDAGYRSRFQDSLFRGRKARELAFDGLPEAPRPPCTYFIQLAVEMPIVAVLADELILQKIVDNRSDKQWISARITVNQLA
jgi:hypothetical protein